MITDDIDSLFSATVLKKHTKSKVRYFYDFSNLYMNGNQDHEVIAVDCAMERDIKCWDNHVTLFASGDNANPNSANINNLLQVSRENYFHKYCMGTHLQVISYYDAMDFKQLSDEQKLILWAIDASYKGFYSKYDNDRQMHSWFVELLELEDLAEVLHRYTMDDVIEVMKKYKLDKKIYFNEEGYLHTEIELDKLQVQFPEFDLSLPNDHFTLRKELKSQTKKLDEGKMDYHKSNNLFSFALTGKNRVSYTSLK
ncbi:hypothetical protein [Paenibacillus elgii]|uniref:hypothetical protein n=1 Tax=Paenibacillus elgii TaxID=189691 RepID=UPI00203E34E1|nr:hypothetical protein [Paenibacillus elgii]MCM3271148.1 hypothetical protein [Paenibacillus elgii]